MSTVRHASAQPSAVQSQDMSASPMGVLEWAFLQLQARHPACSLEIGELLRFAGPAPGLAELRDYVAARVPTVPELRAAPAWPRWPRSRPQWVDLPLDLADRVQRRVLPGSCAQAGPLAAAEELMAERLPPNGHPWQVWLLEGYADDEWALLVKAHHARFDGASMWSWARRFLGGSPPTEPRRRRNAQRPPVRSDLRRTITGSLRFLRGFFPLDPRAFRVSGLTGYRVFSCASIELERLAQIGRQHSGTVNDVFLAALAGALRAWPATPWRHGAPRPVWALVPVDTRALDGSPEMGNRLATTRLRLPCHEADPASRLAAVIQSSNAAKRGGRADVTRAGTTVLPAWLVRSLFRWTMAPRHTSLIASNMTGSATPLSFDGRALREAMPLGFIPHQRPLGGYLSTVASQATFCAAIDAAVPAGGDLARLWLDAVEELERVPPPTATG